MTVALTGDEQGEGANSRYYGWGVAVRERGLCGGLPPRSFPPSAIGVYVGWGHEVGPQMGQVSAYLTHSAC